MKFLEIADEQRTITKSSISQARGTALSTTNGIGQFFPIVFDSLDYIDCDKVKSHPIIVTDTNELGYDYPVKECNYYTDQYIYTDDVKTEMRALPHWFGEGLYKAYVNKNTLTNFDGEAFGTRNEITTQSGLHYVTATKTLTV